MLTRFEHFAVTEMMGQPDTPPRLNGTLCFSEDWQRTAFGIALALAKQGCFEWDDFRDQLISEIAAWETTHAEDREAWDYYACWQRALETAVSNAGMIAPNEVAEMTARN